MTYSISRSILTPLLGLCFTVACSSTPTPKSASGFSSAPMAKSEQTAPAKPAEQTATVSIDDAILRACHIGNDEAYFAFDSAKLEGRDVSPLGSVAKCFTQGQLKGHSLKSWSAAPIRAATTITIWSSVNLAPTASALR